MPRGRKKYTLNEHLEMVVDRISKTEQELKDLKAHKKDLERQLKNQALSELQSLIENSGMSIDEVKSLFDNP